MLKRLFQLLILLIAFVALALIAFRLAAHLRETADLADVIPSEGQIVQTTMGDIYIETRGPETGQAVLLAHGSVGWAGFWDETLQAMADAGYYAIAFDMPPMGYSTRDPDSDYRRKTQAQRLLALIEALDTKPILAAHSFGAGPGMEAVMVNKDAFQGLVIIDGAIGIGSHLKGTTLPAPLKPTWIREYLVSATITNPLLSRRLLQLFLYRKDRATDEYLDVLARPANLKGSTKELAKWLPYLIVPPQNATSTRRDSYADISLQTAILWGAEDTTTPLAQGEELANLISGSTLTVLPDVGHIPQIEDPVAFQAALLKILSEF